MHVVVMIAFYTGFAWLSLFMISLSPNRMVNIFCSLGYFPGSTPSSLLPYIVIIALVATIVESLPINQVSPCILMRIVLL